MLYVYIQGGGAPTNWHASVEAPRQGKYRYGSIGLSGGFFVHILGTINRAVSRNVADLSEMLFLRRVFSTQVFSTKETRKDVWKTRKHLRKELWEMQKPLRKKLWEVLKRLREKLWETREQVVENVERAETFVGKVGNAETFAEQVVGNAEILRKNL